MMLYKNLSGQSNVGFYAYVDDIFIVKFKDGIHYLYSTNKNSLDEIQKMKQLADDGIGLGAMLATKPHHPHDVKWI